MKLEDIINEPWELIIDDEEASRIKIELSKEINKNHTLNGTNCHPIAKRIDRDDILFKITPHLCEYAVVHLTWSGKEEKDRLFPHVDIYTDLEHLKNERISPVIDGFA